MNINNKALIVAFLLLFFFVATSSGFASISSVQEQLRLVQLKLIKEKIKLIQEQILGVGKPKSEPAPVSISAPAAATMTVAELTKSLEVQINALESVVSSLKPKVLDEETARIERKIAAISKELQTATGDKLLALQNELQKATADYENLQQAVRQALEDSIKDRQAIVLREQIRGLQQKLTVLQVQDVGRVSLVVPAAPNAPALSRAVTTPAQVIQTELEKAKLRLIQAQVKAIQEKIQQMRAK